jgi:hypothetical protein
MKVQQELDETKIILVRAVLNLDIVDILNCAVSTAQDDRVSSRTWRETGQPRRPFKRPFRSKQDVLQNGQEGTSGLD